MKKSAAVTPRVTLQRSLLSMAVAAATFGMAPAHAVQFEFMDGEVQGSFDTTVSYGALWRVTGQDPRLLSQAKDGTRDSANYDNGNANYRRGEQVNSVFRVLSDLELKYQNFGAFVRIGALYDHEIQNKNFDPALSDKRTLRNRLGHDYEIYDAFVRGSFTVAGRNLDLRLGKQVVSWGESTFIPNGLNVLNPVDVSKLRSPGAELKEAFLPIQMAQVQFGITDNVSLELVNIFQFRDVRLEPNGSFFSTNDFASPGGSQVYISTALGIPPEETAEQDPLVALAGGNPANVFIPRGNDRRASHTGQYGAALRFNSEKLNNTEFGLYYLNYHSRVPLISGTTSSAPPPSPGTTDPNEAAANALTLGANATYYNEFPEDIAVYGLSFNTLGPLGIAFQGEYSYRPNMPLQLGANNLLSELLSFGAAPLKTGIEGLNTLDPASFGKEISGFKRTSMHQVQVTGTQTLGRYFGADQIIALAEIGYVHIDIPNNIDFNGPGVDFTSVNNMSSRKGFMTQNSYGYRAAFRANYNNAIGAINLIPRLAFQHDLRGTSPTFVQGTQAATIGLTAEYQNRISADVSYTNFFAGETIGAGMNGAGAVASTNQQLGDRDFIAATISYAF